jgi:2-iminobutanoate/2-iminopropanoate deaminase
MSSHEFIHPGRAVDLSASVGAPVSPVVKANGFVITSGYVAMHPQTGALINASIEKETELTLEAIKTVLGAAGSSLDKVVKAFIFLADIDRDFEGMNSVYEKYFSAPYPTRRTVQAKLVHELKVEIDVMALE